MRADLAIIAEWIKPGSSILDLGCGDGTLLKHLRDKQVLGIGLEISERNIETCLRDNLNIIQSDLNDGLKAYFSDNSFDYVVMSQTLQATVHPEQLIDEMLRVGKQGIVTFPNMAHWKARVQLGLGGYMPVTKSLPNRWYNTPNIHLCTVKDFEILCRERGIRILERTFVDYTHSRSSLLMKLFPNLFSEIALYRFCRGS
ncbi:MAG: methionine biosynthesis protein MetW [Gammaproteobacteria bacterium]|nr:methionine biosynthesis protein MetW [Gammaproteobacteria bacterium]